MEIKIQNSLKVTKKGSTLSLSRHEGVARETREPPPTTIVGENLSDRWSQQMEGISCEGGIAIHLTPQGSVFQLYLVSRSQFSRLRTRNHINLIWWAFQHCSDSPQTMCTACHFPLMHVSSAIYKTTTSLSLISLPPEEGQSMLTEPLLHYSIIRHTGNGLNITSS